MTLKFYFDTHIAKAVAVQLRTRGIDVVRCEEVGMATVDDEAHLIYATEQGRIMVSQDDDFLVLDNEYEHAGIMYNPKRYQGEGQISHLVQWLSFYHEAAEAGAIDYETEIKDSVTYI